MANVSPCVINVCIGLTATYAVLRLLLQDASPSTAGGDKEEIFGDLLGSTLQKWKKRLLQGVYRFIGIDYHRIRLLNQRKESMDLVLQLLVNNGGRVEDIHGDYDTGNAESSSTMGWS